MGSNKIKKPKHWSNAFTLAEGGHSPLLCGDEGAQASPRLVKRGFTLAEVLITLGVIGVVAAVTMPTLVTNIQERVRKEQVRTVKYKLTKATDSMKSQDKIAPYATTETFINELKKHFAISKVCKNNELRACWSSETINTPDGAVSVNSIKNGVDIKALALGTAQTETIGIVTGDGTPMILLYSPVCTPLDPVKTYTWSVVDGKPETNATTNCISAIFDINGSKGPNKIGQDVRTLNSLFGSAQYNAVSMSKSDCLKYKDQLGINACGSDPDYFAGAVKKCHDIGLHLPSMQTLANIAGAKYGRTDIGTYTLIMKNGFESGGTTYTDCKQFYTTHNYGSRVELSDNIICVSELDASGEIPSGANSSVGTLTGDFWSSSEVSDSTALWRDIFGGYSSWSVNGRNNIIAPLCVGD